MPASTFAKGYGGQVGVLSWSTQGRGLASLYHLSTPSSLSVMDATVPAMSRQLVPRGGAIAKWRILTLAPGAPVSDPAGIEAFSKTRRIGDRRSASPAESVSRCAHRKVTSDFRCACRLKESSTAWLGVRGEFQGLQDRFFDLQDGQ